jgi:diguanylate cyclase (GGDEF)-like protein
VSVLASMSDGEGAGHPGPAPQRGRPPTSVIESVRTTRRPPAGPERLHPLVVAGVIGLVGAGVVVIDVLLGESTATIAVTATAVVIAAWCALALLRARRTIAAREADVRRVLGEASAGCLWTWGPGDRAWFADCWAHTFGIEPGAAPDLGRWFDRVHSADIGPLVHGFEQLRAGAQRRLRRTYRISHRGDYRYFELHAVAVDSRRGVVLAGTTEDVTVRYQAQERLSHSAFHDALTTLPNRALFLDRLSHCHARARRNPRYHFAVVFLDIDDFKVLNDSLGHHAGDELLALVARRLHASVRPGDTVARIGGDEFTVLLEPLTDQADAEAVTGRIRAALHGPTEVAGHIVQLSTSVGIAMSSPTYVDPLDLLRDADTAMYHAKRDGPGLWRRFDQGMHESAMRRLRVESELRRGLVDDGLMVYFQPIVSLVTGNIEGFEALARLRGADGKLISPVEFIPLSENLGLVDDVLDRVLAKTGQALAAWSERHPNVYVSVNVSGRSLRPGLVERINATLKRWQVPARRVKVELTESVLVTTSPQATQQLMDLRDLGIGLYIDDFGTGYSSLSYLHQFPVDHIKLDRTFVAALDGQRMPDIVETIVTLSRRLGAAVIAEGIETKAQLTSLRALNCTLGQGWLFAPAVPVTEATALLDADAAWDVSIDRAFSLPLPGI